MAKIIRPTYPLNFSIGLLILIFVLSTFISLEIFAVKWRVVMEGGSPLVGMFLAAVAVVVMALILWEEFLFPVRIKPIEDEIIFRNHFTKLKTQVLIYCVIPVIVGFIYLNYQVNYFWFIAWAAICIISPAGKLISGIKNYNDFLKLTNNTIAYKNNDKEGVFPVQDIQEIALLRDEANVLHKVQVLMQNSSRVVIDLDEMELEAYYETIDEFINHHYKAVVR
ncbi:heavy metal transporter [Chryseolinea sp. H1M3-3]|uniref:heavy metal transporter n=1 Tax=Chryseolinea sp. H1M3-3 TaxID=3034144 RepID=UPI0023EB7DAF|nr:heavy metal transporter [Chryseolinea sp. H1M3-3]